MVKKFPYQLEQLNRDQVWLVAVSGGRDSVMLLDVLVKAGFKRLVVVHVNHQLRAEDSDEDARLVERLASKYALEFYAESVNVRALVRRQKKGLELAARELRHAVFARAMIEHSAVGVFLGHHADDQAETVLFNLLRGSNGLKGMRFKSSVNVAGVSLMLLRPLLNVRRSEIDCHIEKHDLEYREDTSNAVPFTARNRLRNEVMPLLKDIMQREVVPSIDAAAEVSESQSEYIAGQLDFESHLDPQGRIYLPSLLGLDVVLKELIMFQYLKQCGIPELSRALVVSCLRLCDINSPAQCNLPGGTWLRRKEKRLFVQSSGGG